MNALKPGQQLGPYQIIQQIGKGGMATVYKAYHPSMDRYVALKVVSDQLIENTDMLKRFQQEARLIAKLEHPHILPVHDYGETDGVPYMVMRFLEAGTLKDRLTAGPLSLPEIDRIFSQLADALHYAHENGVIHRDIKPSNAMLDKRGDIFLTDFGIAKLLESSAHMTATGAITGTPAYMSPEQAQGQKADQRSDVYSLGIVLYEMLVGRVPFEAETPLAVIFKQIQEPPPPLSVVRPDLPVEIEPVLLRALSKSREYRYASMEEFLAAWKLVYESLGKGIPAPAPNPAIDLDSTFRPRASAPALPAAPETLIAPPVTPIPAAPAAQATAISSKAAPAPQPEPAQKASPATGRRIPWKMVSIGLVVALFGCAALTAFFIIRPRLTARPNNQRSTETNLPATPTREILIAEVTPTGMVALAAPPAESKWQSWMGGNSYYGLALLNGQVYGSGAGGVAVWDVENGTSTKISSKDGLPDSWAPTIYTDPQDQTIWVGTSSGLAHLENGVVTATYTSNNGLDSDYVSAIVRRGDMLVVGTTYCGVSGCGLQEFNGKTWQPVANFPSMEEPDEEHINYSIHALLVDGDSRLWAATSGGLALLDSDGDWNVFKPSSGLPDIRALSLAMDANGDVWVGTGVGGVAKFNPDSWAFEQVLNLNDQSVYDVHGLAFDADGNLWAAGYGLARYNPETEKLDTFNADNGTMPGSNAYSLAVDDNTVFIGTEGYGLMRYNGEFSIWTEPNVLSYASFKHIQPGPDGSIYAVELYMNGTDVFNPTTGTWQWYNGPDGGVPMALDVEGTLWLGGYNGLWEILNGDTTHFDTRLGLPSKDIYQVQVAEDGTIYTINGEGLTILKDGKVQKSFAPGDSGFCETPLSLIYLAPDQNLYAAANDGRMVGKYSPDTQSWTWLDLPQLLEVSPQPITSVTQAPRGLVVGTLGNGLYRFRDGKWENIQSTDPDVQLPNDYINCLETAPDGALWFCAGDAGVVRYDGVNWNFYTQEDGLADNIVNDIYFAPDGSTWFATNSGITRLEP